VFRLMPKCLQRHFGKLGAGDGGKAFLDELARWRGVVVIRVVFELDCSEIRTARERKSIAVGILDRHEQRAIRDRGEFAHLANLLRSRVPLAIRRTPPQLARKDATDRTRDT